MSSEASSIPPPSDAVIGLAYAETVIAAIIFLIYAVITWRHGKAGMTCWGIVIMAPIAAMIADIYLIINRDDPLVPSAVSTMTAAAVLACMSLGIIGIAYEW